VKKVSLIEKKYKIYVDGPYGAPAQDFTKYPVAILVGAGIGVTPFAAVLQDLLHLVSTWKRYSGAPLMGLQELTRGCSSFPVDFQLRKVHFHWSTRSRDSLSWFKEMMERLMSQDEDGILELHNYLTSASGKTSSLFEVARKQAQKKLGGDAISSLSFKGGMSKVETHLCRPNYDEIFQGVKKRYKGEGFKIGVFFCGPKNIRAMLEECCRKHSDKKSVEGGTRFKLHAENF